MMIYVHTIKKLSIKFKDTDGCPDQVTDGIKTTDTDGDGIVDNLDSMPHPTRGL